MKENFSFFSFVMAFELASAHSSVVDYWPKHLYTMSWANVYIEEKFLVFKVFAPASFRYDDACGLIQ